MMAVSKLALCMWTALVLNACRGGMAAGPSGGQTAFDGNLNHSRYAFATLYHEGEMGRARNVPLAAFVATLVAHSALPLRLARACGRRWRLSRHCGRDERREPAEPSRAAGQHEAHRIPVCCPGGQHCGGEIPAGASRLWCHRCHGASPSPLLGPSIHQPWRDEVRACLFASLPGVSLARAVNWWGAYLARPGALACDCRTVLTRRSSPPTSRSQYTELQSPYGAVIAELNKLYLWTLMEYERVIFIDAFSNVAVHPRALEDLFLCGEFCAVFAAPCRLATGKCDAGPSRSLAACTLADCKAPGTAKMPLRFNVPMPHPNHRVLVQVCWLSNPIQTCLSDCRRSSGEIPRRW